eukprot:10125757-Lingulodinium_polyedra.AAC.1
MESWKASKNGLSSAAVMGPVPFGRLHCSPLGLTQQHGRSGTQPWWSSKATRAEAGPLVEAKRLAGLWAWTLWTMGPQARSMSCMSS